MLNFVLCDDNINALNRFSKMLNLVFVNNDLDGHISLATPNANEVLSFIQNNNVDVVILDIDLQTSMSGIDLAQQIRNVNKKIYIIFATAHLEYLILAYKCKTFDYLTKPISLNNLESTILRLFNDVYSDTPNSSFIKINNRNTIINANSVCYIEKDNTKLIFKSDNADYSVYSSFNKIQPTLPSNFIRCHKSYIVNIHNIESINETTIHFDKTNKLKCYIGQTYRKKFLEVFNNDNRFNTDLNDT
ncbi:MAG: response regulator transcription factor [Clostridia bacterium]|nr:response regulator transcription factor [Clostridia bacterium]